MEQRDQRDQNASERPGDDPGEDAVATRGAAICRIESHEDPRLLVYRTLTDPAAMQRAGLFVAEGRFVVERLLALPRYAVHSILVTPTAFRTLRGERAAPVYVVDQALMNDVVGFNIHRGCLALARRPAVPALADLDLGSLRRVVVLEGVNNPDNVGGIFRSAAAFGVDAIVLGPACGDPLYRKAIRTSMAATLQVPFVDAGAWPRALELLRESGLRALALTTDPKARSLGSLNRGNLPRVALVVGNEGHGLTSAALTACDDRVRIDMTGGVDSLNVTVAASIAMHCLL
jgi:tRNA G18 (ribose-2'-O)-methylase SpoU